MHFDLVIVGGGMVGGALASALHSSPLKVALIDATPTTNTEDPRLIALNYNSICLFKNLNLWSNLLAEATPIQEIHVSKQKQFGITRIKAKELQLPYLGYVIPAKYINTALEHPLKNCTVLRPAKLQNLICEKDHVTLAIETNDGIQNITASIVVGADGTHSTVRRLMQIDTVEINYHQSAIVTTTELQRFHQHIAFERFLKEGAVAMLPLKNNTVATIWTGAESTIQDLMLLSDAEFLEKLQTHFGYRLGRLQSIHKRHYFPLHYLKAKQTIFKRIILIGNAAHTFHPIAAQGLNLALYEVSILSDYFHQHGLTEITLNDLASKQQISSMQLSHYLNRIFSEDFFIFRKARQMAMIGLDISPFLKKLFTQKAMGRFGLLPSLVRENEIHESKLD